MTVPPLFDHLDSEDEDQLLRDTAPRDTGFGATAGLGVDDDTRPAGAHPRLWAWLHVEPFYWTMRVVYVCLAAGAVFAVYINGVAEGWWHAWGEKPSVAATTPATQPAPTASPSASGEAAMSGGYQIGPDGILVRPAQYAADTYTKPELPEEAKENTERGAEAAAEHFHALMGYTWNTGDVQPIQDFSDPSSQFVSSYVQDVSDLYASGWAYGSESQIMHVLKVEPIAANGADIPPNTVTVAFRLKSTDGTTCRGQKIRVKDEEYESTLILLMTWKGDRWIETQATIRTGNEQ